LKLTHEEKLKKAKEYLGEKWVLHPNYKYDSRHAQFGHNTGKFTTMVIPRTMKEAGL